MSNQPTSLPEEDIEFVMDTFQSVNRPVLVPGIF